MSAVSNITAPTGPPAAPAGAAAVANDPLTSKDTFLKLLVAQLQNQNPLNPSDPIQFLTQLTSFSSLEQSLAMRQDLDAIRGALGKPVSPDPAGIPQP